VLTNRKATLPVYARALEARDVPVEVTGAAVGLENELHELVILLEALSDPSNTTLTIAVMVGLFFGIDYEELLWHKDVGGTFSFLDDQLCPNTPVMTALSQMKKWFELARREPADVAIPRIIEDIGLLPHAAGGDLGATRAGALLFALDTVRAAGLAGDTSLRAAIEAIRVATDATEAEAPLEPGRSDVVRVMNVHKAKGLEAPVVVLAFPTGEWDGTPTIHVERPASGNAIGYVRVEEKAESFTMRTLAQPRDWPARAAVEKEFEKAEDIRLLYVAVTRAAEELVVSRCMQAEDRSPWRALYPHFAEDQRVEIEFKKPSPRQRLELEASEVKQREAIVEDLRAESARPTFTAESVRERAKRTTAFGVAAAEPVPQSLRADQAPRGTEWGVIVHSALEVAARGADAHKLEIACRGLLLDHERPLDSRGDPAELPELLEVVRGMINSEIWKRAMRSGSALVEVPFAAVEVNEEMTGIMDGVIDLAFREKDGWVIVDYKSDVISNPDEWRQRTEMYRRQVHLYADYWEQLTGEQVVERVLVFTSIENPLERERSYGKPGPTRTQQLAFEI